MTILYIGVSADSVCFGRCTSHNCTKYLALARFRCYCAFAAGSGGGVCCCMYSVPIDLTSQQTDDAVRKSCLASPGTSTAANKKIKKENIGRMDVNCPLLLITNIKPLRRRIQAESLLAWNCHLDWRAGKKGVSGRQISERTALVAISRTTALVSSDTAFVRTHARTV
ncbi:hypothetical protein CFAM422_011214 [Trichoderma lentiforme]|uniref:Uncharacterized protein n=1 Tax=Trichoderma lentiforme TaxID=1567552 RepID=A0A9P4X4S2_9HYPO|nr:hypothetical protein CFAM422_011214 [Trichoderma lentiforme]